MESAQPFETAERVIQRRTQRELASVIPDYVIAANLKMKPLELPDSASERLRMELGIRDWIESALTEDEKAVFDRWREAWFLDPVRRLVSRSLISATLPVGRMSARFEADQKFEAFARAVASDLDQRLDAQLDQDELSPAIVAIMVMLRWADLLADDGYHDLRFAPR